MNGLKAPRTGMLTGATLACNGLTIASSELAQGFIVAVCAACRSDALQAAIAHLPNVSHGLCEPCLDLAFREMDARYGPETVAADGRAAA